MTKVGVVLSGCGFLDGGEVQESVLALLFLDRKGFQIVPIAPDKAQADVVDHATGEALPDEHRSVFVEAARIVRAAPTKASEARAEALDALVIPGGFGAAKNLCDFASKGAECTADADVARLIRECHASGKPIGAICIAPALVARLLGAEHGVEVTIGTDAGTASVLREMGARHADRSVTEVCVDAKNKVVTTPAYMLGERISEVAVGIEKLVDELEKML